MRRLAILPIALGGLVSLGYSQSLQQAVDAQMPGLFSEYKHLHEQPELSHHEKNAASEVAARLRDAGYTVTEHIGRYPDGSQAFGVVGVLKNGPGKTLLIRTELDALPVKEQTGAPYASTVLATNAANQEVGVMHACGHDIHMTTVMGVAKAMAELRSSWSGTLILIGQPSEETGDGARAMLADGLYERFGRPDLILGLHDTNNFPAGKVSVVPGGALSGETSIDVTMRGIGAHGSTPELGKDPIVMGSEFVVALQALITRQISARTPAVITVGDFHGGAKRNIIPDSAKLELTARSYDEETNDKLVAGIKRTANSVAEMMDMPADRMPIVEVLEHHPVTYNDPALSAKVHGILVDALGQQNVLEGWPVMNSDDFGILNLGHTIPSVLYWLGIEPQEKWEESKKTGVPTPSPHSPFFLPQYEPALRTGVSSLTTVAIHLLSK